MAYQLCCRITRWRWRQWLLGSSLYPRAGQSPQRCFLFLLGPNLSSENVHRNVYEVDLCILVPGILCACRLLTWLDRDGYRCFHHALFQLARLSCLRHPTNRWDVHSILQPLPWAQPMQVLLASCPLAWAVSEWIRWTYVHKWLNV